MNEETLVGLMIEDKEGVENIQDILSVEGIDFIYIGKMDMHCLMEFHSNREREKMLQLSRKQ